MQYFATTYVVQENEWDAVKSKVVKSKAWSHLESPDRMNFNINSEYNRIYRMVENALANNPNLNFSQLKAQIKGERNLTFDFYELAQEIIDRYRSNNSFGTYDKCMSYVRKLKQFAQRLDIHTVDLNFINKYEDYLRNGPKYELRKNSIKNSPNTIHSNLKFIRQVMNEAVNRDLISNSENPFSKKVLVTAKNEALKTAFEKLTPGRQKAYCMHFNDAKQTKTRLDRIEKYTDRILKGKGIMDCVCGLSKRMPTCDGSHKQLKQ